MEMVKRLLVILVAIVLGIVGYIPIHAANFYAIGYEYQSPYHLLKLEGNISTAKVIADNCGKAGIEQDITIVTDTGKLMFEVVNWYKRGKVLVGITVYRDGEDYFTEKVPAVEGQVYDYQVYIFNGSVYVTISSGREVVYHKVLRDVGARYIPRTASYVEYKQDCNCSFYYYGWVSITNTKYLDSKVDDFYRKNVFGDLDIYFVHHTWKGNDSNIFYLDKGEVDDRH